MIWETKKRKQFENLARNLRLVYLTENVTITHDPHTCGFLAKESDQEPVFFMTTELYWLVKFYYGSWFKDEYSLRRVLWCFYKMRCAR